MQQKPKMKTSFFFFFFFLVLLVSLMKKSFFSCAVLVVMQLLLFLALHLINLQWIKPQRLRKKLERQGIKGPPPSFLYGNVQEMQKIQATVSSMKGAANFGEFVAHDYTSFLFPYFEQWRKQYGNIPNIPSLIFTS